jgi:hypothetical protein
LPEGTHKDCITGIVSDTVAFTNASFKRYTLYVGYVFMDHLDVLVIPSLLVEFKMVKVAKT